MSSSAIKSKLIVGLNNKDVNGVIAKDFVNALKGQDKFTIKEIKEGDINNLVADGKVDSAITIPENFDESVYNASISKIGITAIKGQEATGWVQSLTVHTNVVKDTSIGESKTVQSVGFLIMFMLFGATTTSGLILKEKKEKTYFRIFSSPVSSRIYIGANILSNMGIMVAQSILIIVSSKYIFKLNTGVPDLHLLAILVLFGFVCVTLGILLVAFSDNTRQSSTIATLIIVPTCMLSGCWWPLEIMPKFMQQIANFLPQTWALEGVKELQNGKTFLSIVPILGILAIFSLAFFLIAMYKMKSSESVKNFI